MFLRIALLNDFMTRDSRLKTQDKLICLHTGDNNIIKLKNQYNLFTVYERPGGTLQDTLIVSLQQYYEKHGRLVLPKLTRGRRQCFNTPSGTQNSAGKSVVSISH